MIKCYMFCFKVSFTIQYQMRFFLTLSALFIPLYAGEDNDFSKIGVNEEPNLFQFDVGMVSVVDDTFLDKNRFDFRLNSDGFKLSQRCCINVGYRQLRIHWPNNFLQMKKKYNPVI